MMFVDILRFTGYPVAKTTFFERKMRLMYPRERFICTQLELSSPYRRMKSRLDAMSSPWGYRNRKWIVYTVQNKYLLSFKTVYVKYTVFTDV